MRSLVCPTFQEYLTRAMLSQNSLRRVRFWNAQQVESEIFRDKIDFF